jgi:hypothetical protein
MSLLLLENDARCSRGCGWSRQAWVAAILGLAARTLGCNGGSVRGAQPQGPAGVPVKIQTVQLVPVRDTTEYVATLKSRDSAVIMPQVEGQITAIYVRSGTRVSLGTPLMQTPPGSDQIGSRPGPVAVTGPAGARRPGNRAAALLPRDRAGRGHRRRHPGTDPF